ncbi:Putative uncharacterized protein [Moritella viscosa]|nr:Putative uncharacterized protein [Moritella viscosa]
MESLTSKVTTTNKSHQFKSLILIFHPTLTLITINDLITSIN